MMNQLASIETLFYLAGLIAIVASIKVVTQKNTVHALLYLVVSLLAVAVCFYLMGAPFAAGLEVIVYAGAILILFVFAIMMFGLKEDEVKYAPQSKGLTIWLGPCFLALSLLIELVVSVGNSDIQQRLNATVVSSKQVGALLYGPYLLAVEIASFLLLAGLISSYHYAKPDSQGGHL
jgi:NADH-quinone oxidoreductase subunit J